MEKAKSIDNYFEIHQNWNEELKILRDLANKMEFSETLKWGIPTYTINGKNVVSIAAFKNYVGLWFFNGSFLKDTQKKLQNAQDGKTKVMRQWRFYSTDEIDEKLINAYLLEAIENQKAGKQHKIKRNKKPLIIPVELENVLKKDTELSMKFEEFTLSKQREFADYIADAKRDATKQSRLEKIIPMIKSNIGLHDKYRNC